MNETLSYFIFLAAMKPRYSKHVRRHMAACRHHLRHGGGVDMRTPCCIQIRVTSYKMHPDVLTIWRRAEAGV